MPPQHIDASALLRELNDHNSFFDDLVDIIPAKLYIAGNTGDEMYNPKYRKGQHKESKESRRARNKQAKQSKFDPSMAETTRETKRRKNLEDADGDSSSNESGDEIMDNHEEETDSHDNVDGIGTSGKKREAGDWTEKDGKTKSDKQSKSSNNKKDAREGGVSPSDVTPNPGQSRIEALRAKLKAKIEEKRSSRPMNGGEDESAAVSKRAARRAEKNRRIELAKKKNANKGGSTKTGRDTSHDASKLKITKDFGSTKIQSKLVGDINLMDDLSGIDFGGIAGLKSVSHHTNNKSLSNMGKKKSLEKLLAEAEQKRARLKELKASSSADDKAKASKIEWGDTLKVASGEKTNSDPNLIKKALKRKVKKKAKSQEAWKSRMEQVKTKMDERQNIRNHNIEKRKLGGAAGANLSKKRIITDEDKSEDREDVGTDLSKKTTKRPRLGPHSLKARAGFEGKKKGFLNKEGKNDAQ